MAHIKLIRIACLLFLLCRLVYSNFFKQFEDYIAAEESRLAREGIESDLLGGTDNPKEIEIHCPQVLTHT